MLSLALLVFPIVLFLTLWLRRLVRRSGVRYAEDAPQRVHAVLKFEADGVPSGK